MFIYWVFIIGTVLAVVWGMNNFFVGNDIALKVNNVGHENHSGIFLAIILVLVSSFIIHKKEYWHKQTLALWSAQIIMLAGLIITISRAAWAGYAGFILFVIVKGKKKWVIGILSLLILLSPLIFFNSYFKKKIFRAVSMEIRLRSWHTALVLYSYHPFLGIGLNHFEKINYEKYKVQKNIAFLTPTISTLRFFLKWVAWECLLSCI